MYYQINEKRIFSERFENETIIIDLTTGVYYSLNFTASIIWEALKQGLLVADIAQIIARKLSTTSTQSFAHVTTDTQSFVEKLKNLALIELSTRDHSSSELNFDFDIQANTYSTPTIEVHDDVKDLLLADIVHSVEEDGWPKVVTDH